MRVEQLFVIGDECPAHQGLFGMTEQTARAIMNADIDRVAICDKAINEERARADKERVAREGLERQLERGLWWEENGLTVAATVGGVSIVVGGVTGFFAGQGVRR